VGARSTGADGARESATAASVGDHTRNRWKMGTVSRIAVAFLACVFAFASPASPCRCGSGPAFGAYAASDEVFIGRVVGRREQRAPGFAFPAVRLRVLDTLKGTATGDVDVLPDSVCPFHFEVTGDYFVYANLDPEGRLIVAQCSRTNRVEHAGADLAYARGVASGKSGAVVWGGSIWNNPYRAVGGGRKGSQFGSCCLARRASLRRR
jgi:hypothetical protein